MNIEAQAVYKFMAWAQINADMIYGQDYIKFFDNINKIAITNSDSLIFEFKKEYSPIKGFWRFE